MPSIRADFQDRRRVVFTGRGRSSVNVRQVLDDGPIGFTSIELLLIALGNCSLGTMLNHPLLKDEPVYEAVADIDAEMGVDPDRVTSVHWNIRLVVEDDALIPYAQELASIAIDCPTCNSLSAERSAYVSIWTRADVGARAPIADVLGDDDGASCVIPFPAELEETLTVPNPTT